MKKITSIFLTAIICSITVFSGCSSESSLPEPQKATASTDTTVKTTGNKSRLMTAHWVKYGLPNLTEYLKTHLTTTTLQLTAPLNTIVKMAKPHPLKELTFHHTAAT